MKELPLGFYHHPELAEMVMNRKDLHELLMHTSGRMLAEGTLWEIVSKHIGAGVYRVTVKQWKNPARRVEC